MRELIVGIDIGGTFTDVISIDRESGSIYLDKILTDVDKPWTTFIKGVEKVLERVGEARIKLIVHGTTLGSNMLLGQTGLEIPKALLITNEGFEDVIEIGRQNRPELYNIFFEKPKPLIPRRYRIGVRGRINSKGEVIEDIDEDEIRRKMKGYIGDIETIIISLLNSYLNPTHEIRIGDIISSINPELFITKGSEVDPRPGEYERTISAVIDGLLKPLISKYLGNLRASLEKIGYRYGLIVMTSNGGVIEAREAIEKPTLLIESGPAAGTIAAAHLAKTLNEDAVIALDMGGTTSKASAILDGEPLITTEFEVGGKVHMGRIVRGSGYPLRIPHIDIAEIGVGGGSIIWIDVGGQLRVGPISAGSTPGPACYNRGGSQPTLTDAYLILGWLPEVLGGGEIRLSKEAAYKAFDALSDRLGMPKHVIAYKAVEIANEHLRRAISIVSVERGYDISEFTIILFGGAGPIHTTFLVELGFKKALIPPYSGVFSAYGLVQTDYRYVLQRGVNSHVDRKLGGRLARIYREMEDELFEILERDGIDRYHIHIKRYLEMRYWRQGKNLIIPYEAGVEDSVKEFINEYRERYGYAMDEEPYIETAILEAEIENRFKISLKGREYRPHTPEKRGVKEAYFDGEWVETDVYNWLSLEPGATIEGPAIIYSADSTVVIRPHYRLLVDGYGVLEVERLG